jgi:hypothetical protein
MTLNQLISAYDFSFFNIDRVGERCFSWKHWKKHYLAIQLSLPERKLKPRAGLTIFVESVSIPVRGLTEINILMHKLATLQFPWSFSRTNSIHNSLSGRIIEFLVCLPRQNEMLSLFLADSYKLYKILRTHLDPGTEFYLWNKVIDICLHSQLQVTLTRRMFLNLWQI